MYRVPRRVIINVTTLLNVFVLTRVYIHDDIILYLRLVYGKKNGAFSVIRASGFNYSREIRARAGLSLLLLGDA